MIVATQAAGGLAWAIADRNVVNHISRISLCSTAPLSTPFAKIFTRCAPARSRIRAARRTPSLTVDTYLLNTVDFPLPPTCYPRCSRHAAEMQFFHAISSAALTPRPPTGTNRRRRRVHVLIILDCGAASLGRHPPADAIFKCAYTGSGGNEGIYELVRTRSPRWAPSASTPSPSPSATTATTTTPKTRTAHRPRLDRARAGLRCAGLCGGGIDLTSNLRGIERLHGKPDPSLRRRLEQPDADGAAASDAYHLLQQFPSISGFLAQHGENAFLQALETLPFNTPILVNGFLGQLGIDATPANIECAARPP